VAVLMWPRLILGRQQWGDAMPNATAMDDKHTSVRGRGHAGIRPSLPLRINAMGRGETKWENQGWANDKQAPSFSAVQTTAPAKTAPRHINISVYGRNIAKYIGLATEARMSMEVAYDWAGGTGRLSGSVNTNVVPSSVRIAQYSHVYGPSPVWSTNFTECDRACDPVGRYGDVAAAAQADVVIFNLMAPPQRPFWPRPPGQLWVGTYFESPDHYPSLRNASILAQFNYTMGYRPDADFPLFNMVLDTAKDVNKTLAWPLPPYHLKQGRPMMATWISNCLVDTLGRLPLLDELEARNVSIVSYGRCGPGLAKPKVGPDLNACWRKWATTGGPGAEKAAVSTQHLFMFAAENSGCAYYNTEKVFHALVAGSVPVYLGDGTSLKKLAPLGSVIYAADFKSAAVLAEHLRFLAGNRTAYEAYLAWRRDFRSLDALHRVMAFPAWEVDNAGTRACALCEFLWAAPRRQYPKASADLCQHVGGKDSGFRLL